MALDVRRNHALKLRSRRRDHHLSERADLTVYVDGVKRWVSRGHGDTMAEESLVANRGAAVRSVALGVVRVEGLEREGEPHGDRRDLPLKSIEPLVDVGHRHDPHRVAPRLGIRDRLDEGVRRQMTAVP